MIGVGPRESRIALFIGREEMLVYETAAHEVGGIAVAFYRGDSYREATEGARALRDVYLGRDLDILPIVDIAFKLRKERDSKCIVVVDPGEFDREKVRKFHAAVERLKQPQEEDLLLPQAESSEAPVPASI